MLPLIWKKSSIRGKLKHASIIFSFVFLQTSILGSYNVGHTVGSTIVFDMISFPPCTELVTKHFLLPSKESMLQEISSIYFSICIKWKLHQYSGHSWLDHKPSSIRAAPPKVAWKVSNKLQIGWWPQRPLSLDLFFICINAKWVKQVRTPKFKYHNLVLSHIIFHLHIPRSCPIQPSSLQNLESWLVEETTPCILTISLYHWWLPRLTFPHDTLILTYSEI